jgi:hypothetical protein
MTQCFKCQAWGHTSFACAKQQKCGRCAGPHETSTCEKEKPSCANCGKDHPTWHRHSCEAFESYHSRVQLRRAMLASQTSSIRNADKPQQATTDGWTSVTGKRRREHSPPNTQQQRRIGRPTAIETAAREASQRRIEFAAPSQPTHTMEAMDTTPTSSNE